MEKSPAAVGAKVKRNPLTNSTQKQWLFLRHSRQSSKQTPELEEKKKKHARINQNFNSPDENRKSG
ncbi:MAG: hypothetical protein E6Q29_15005 [Alicycliphilus sp.]|jgi:hypothetical protein|nr:MAG: hypothetical protein E6Q29_15005 [Alicycliphilus sp.]